MERVYERAPDCYSAIQYQRGRTHTRSGGTRAKRYMTYTPLAKRQRPDSKVPRFVSTRRSWGPVGSVSG